MKFNRRKFINSLLGIGGISTVSSVIYPVLSYLSPPEVSEPKVTSIKVGSVNDFEINSAKIIKYGRTPLILIRKDSGEFAALAATCTHLDCIVQYNKDKKQIICACHNGVYDLKGKNLSGPPPKPLQEYLVQIIDDEIVITSMEV